MVSEKQQNKKIYRLSALILAVFLFVVMSAMCLYIFVGPYDPGTLSVTGSCANLSSGGYVNDFKGTSTYFVEGDAMYCLDTQGNKTIILDGKEISHINPDSNYIYYISENKIYSIHNRVTITKLTDKDAVAMSVNGGWIYFLDTDGVLNKMSTDGKIIRELSAVNVTGDFAVDNGMIYYVDGNQLYSIRANGLESTKKLLTSDIDEKFCYADRAIFYRNTSGEIWSLDAETGETKLKREEATVFNYSYNTLCFVDTDGVIRVKRYVDDTEFVCEDYTDAEIESLFVTGSGDVWAKTRGADPVKITLKDK